jgi:hypothetical protein
MLKGLLKKLKKGTTTNPLIENSPYVPYGEREPLPNAPRDFPRQANVMMGNTLARTKREGIRQQEMKKQLEMKKRKMMMAKKVDY